MRYLYIRKRHQRKFRYIQAHKTFNNKVALDLFLYIFAFSSCVRRALAFFAVKYFRCFYGVVVAGSLWAN